MVRRDAVIRRVRLRGSLFVLAALTSHACGSPTSSGGLPAEQPALGTKFHPGHYGLVPNWSTLDRQLHKIEGSNFKGFQIRYNWRDLEPTKDAYDFSAMEADLKVLTDRGLRLVVQLQDKSFSATPGVPGYLLQDPTYGGGVLPQGTGGSMPLLWNQRVLEREQALLNALAARFDDEPNFEALNFTETAFHKDGAEAFGYTDTAYFAALVKRMRDTKRAFAHTIVIQYANWLSGSNLGTSQEALASLVVALREAGGGWGGPDIVPYPLPGRTPIPAYPFYSANAGTMPLGASVQVPEMGGKQGTFTAEELFDFGVESLRLNYMFWVTVEDTPENSNPPGFTKAVVPYVEGRGGLVVNVACPGNVAPCRQ